MSGSLPTTLALQLQEASGGLLPLDLAVHIGTFERRRRKSLLDQIQRGCNPRLRPDRSVLVTPQDPGENNLVVADAWHDNKVASALFASGREHEARWGRLRTIRGRQKASGRPTRGIGSSLRHWIRLDPGLPGPRCRCPLPEPAPREGPVRGVRTFLPPTGPHHPQRSRSPSGSFGVTGST